MKKLLVLLALASCLPALAESQVGQSSASARVHLTVVVPPVNVIQSITPVPGGAEYRGWTNMRSATLGGKQVTFPSTPGPYAVVVPALILPANALADNLGTIASP